MTKKSLGRLFSILTALLVVLLPVSYAQQLSEFNASAEDVGITPQAVNANTCSDALGVSLDVNYYAYINYAGDVDWFYWDLPSSGQFTADLDVPSSRDYELEVYTSCSSKVCSSTNGSGVDEKCTVTAGAGKVYAKVWGYKSDYSASDKYYIKGTFKQFDLVAYGFKVTPGSPKHSDSISVLYEVKNNGPDDVTSYFNYKLYIDDELKHTCNANSGLKAGWYGYCNRTGLSLSAGDHTLKLVADADSNIAETNENNNVKTQARHVAGYDLVPGEFTVTPSTPKETDSITIRYHSINNGPDDITGAFKYKLYIDSVLYYTCLSDNGQKVGAAYCERTGLKLSEGTHTLKNIVDADNQIAETDENNNVKTQELTVSSSCPSDKPYKYDGSCHKCPSDSLECGGSCYNKGNTCDYGEPYCGSDNNAYCCSSTYPYKCPAANTCFKKAEYCDGRTIYACQDTKWVCVDKTAVGTCSGSSLKCCPSSYPYYWESDTRCHTTEYTQVSCPVPDGTSSQCDCNSNSDCPSSHPYCEENYHGYDAGYDACLSSEPEYCGNALCASSENYNTCPQDCAAPKGKIIVDVSSTAGKPVSGAHVYLDTVPKGSTDNSGKASLEADYGSRSVKIECPDRKFCGSKMVSVDGTELVGFACSCNPLGDSDGDGNSNEDELLLGTDVNNLNDNFRTAFSLFERPQSCMDVFGILSILWNNKGDLIQANEIVMNALNTTSIMTADLQENPGVVAQALAKSRISGRLEQSDLTLMQAVESSDDVDGFFTENGAVLVMTDYETSSTAIIAISATCVGTFIGTLYGAGTGVKDDVVAIGDIIKGIWYLATADNEKLASDIKEFMRAIPQLFGNLGELFHDMIVSILEKGQQIVQKTGIFKSDKTAYLQFQIGFTNGFITGYVAEQIAAMFVGAGAILKALKAGKIAELVGKTAKLPALLAKITDNFGGEVASAVKKLKYAEKIVHWTDEEQNLLAELIKLGKNKNVRNIESWLDDAGEAGAKHASGRTGSLRKASKLTDDQLAELMNTNLGKQTLTAADATDDLIVKQSKLVQKWGAKKADDVVTKCSLLIFCDTGRINDLNKILKAMPENLVNDLSPERAVKFLGNKDVIKGAEELSKSIDKATLARYANNVDSFEAISKAAGKTKDKFGSLDNLYPSLKSCFSVSGITTAAICSPAAIEKALADLKELGKFSDTIIDWTLDGMKAGVIDVNKVAPEKLASYVKALGKNPFDSALGDQKLVKMLKREGAATKVGNQVIDDAVVLFEGNNGFGKTHIITKHTQDFIDKLGVGSYDEIVDVMQEVLEKGQKVAANPNDPQNYVLRAVITRGQKPPHPIKIVINQDDFLGSITSMYPD